MIGLARLLWRPVRYVINRGPIGVYRRIHGGDLAAMIAFNALLALVPMLLLLIAIFGYLVKDPARLNTAIDNIAKALPDTQTRDAIETLLKARDQSTRIGLAGLIGLIWVGTSFVTTVARAMDRIYEAPERHFVQNRIRAFVVVVIVTIFLLTSAVTAAVPTYFAHSAVPSTLDSYLPAGTTIHVISYGVSIFTAMVMFGTLHRFLPNAGQTLRDTWPGTLLGSLALFAVSQGFPIYLRLTHRSNRYGAVFGVVWLLLTWFLLLAHILVISTVLNAWYKRRRTGVDAAPIG